MRPSISLSSKPGLQSDYLDRMQKNKIEKVITITLIHGFIVIEICG